MSREIRDVYDLRSAYYSKHPNGHYFDPDTLKFFGESLSTMRLLKKTASITDCVGDVHECYVLSRLQGGYPGGPRRTYAYFDVDTLEDILVA